MNKKQGKKFGFCGMMFGLCMIRLVTCSLRIAWAIHPTVIRLGMAASIFVNVGVVLLYFVNLFFAQRIVRAQHPRFGWSKIFTPIIPLCCAWAVLTIVAIVVVVVQSFYTLNDNTHRIDHIVQLYVQSAFLAIACVPLIIITISTLLHQVPSIRGTKAMDKFGSGSMRAKIAIVTTSSILLIGAAAFKAAVNFLPDVAVTQSTPWYYNRGIFYVFGFAVEIIVLYFYAAVRVDRRFIIPDGASGPYSYAGGFIFAGEAGNEKRTARDSMRHLTGPSSGSLQEYTRSSRSRSRVSVVSWGGISHGDVEPGLGEDGAQVVPYPGVEDDSDVTRPTSIAGIQQEMGWDTKTGKWMLRPISTMSYGQEPASPTEYA